MENLRYRLMAVVVIVTLLFLSIAAASASDNSPLIGHWRAVDLDGSNIQLSIAGGGRGVFQLTFVDDYWSICDGLPGIGRGLGSLDVADPNILHTQMVFQYTSQHESHEYQFKAIYYPSTDTIEYQYVQWYRVGN